ncbi:MAG: TetR/AcrR family transcriptional regulator [Phenylobacterium sp.]|nr:TetR/AcrR family transcriptional regulator [Phenylobacterium sp.]
MPPAPRRSHAERTQRSRDALTAAAARLFAAEGFAGTSTEAVLAEAGLTRGALYHHFRDKRDLFDAVCQRLHAEAAAAIEQAAAAPSDPVHALVAGGLAFVDQMARPEALRILLVEAPSVLGWARWNEIDRAHGFGLLVEGVDEAVAAGALAGDPEVLAHLLNGALNQAVVWAAQSGEPKAMDRVRTGFRQMLEALRV